MSTLSFRTSLARSGSDNDTTSLQMPPAALTAACSRSVFASALGTQLYTMCCTLQKHSPTLNKRGRHNSRNAAKTQEVRW